MLFESWMIKSLKELPRIRDVVENENDVCKMSSIRSSPPRGTEIILLWWEQPL
jgi:hypothetical protein